MDLDVVVVGGGLSGLSSARLLVRAGLEVRVLEARDRVGGRTYSAPVDDATFDLGGQWLGKGHTRLSRLADDLQIETYAQYTQGKRVMFVDDQVRTYSGTIPKLAPWKLIELQLAMSRVNRLTKRIDPAHPMRSKDAAALDAVSLEHTAHEWLRTKNSRDLFAAAARVVFGAEPHEISTQWFLTYAKAGLGFEALLESENGAQQTRFVGGAQTLSNRLAAELGDRVHTSEPVRAIEQDERGVSVITSKGTSRARHAILALPPPLWSRIDFSPALPVLHEQLSQRAPMGATVKCIATYETAFWRNNGLSGESVCDVGPVTTTFDATTSTGRPALVAFVVGQDARTWSERPLEARRDQVLAIFSRLFGPEALTPRVYRDHDWSTEPWTRGCPVSVLGAGSLTACASALRAPFGRVHLAGTEMAREHIGYLEGAIESGERAAAEIVARAT